MAKQPSSDAEVDQMAQAAWSAEVGCIRYKGIDERIRARIRAREAGDAIDIPDSALKR